MVMKKILLLFVLNVLLLSCEKKIGVPSPDIQVDIIYRNQQGLDLLNPANAPHISAADIDVYLLTLKGERRRVYKSNQYMAENFKIDKQENGNYVLSVLFVPDQDCLDKNRMATMYLTYKDGTEDTFVGKFSEKLLQIERLWVNDKLVWEIGSSSQRRVTIIK